MNNEDLCFLSAVEMAAAVRDRTVSPVELTRAMLDRIERYNPALNAFCISMADEALQAAEALESQVQRGETLGPLHGVPVSIKDILYVQNVRTTFGSRLFENYVSDEDAPSIERLRRAGAVFIGRTNTPEFGWKGVTDNRLFGITRNPWNVARTAGGSSGGASAAVAAGMGPIGMGTDGGGSIRIPAAFCGLVGLKASFGRIPNYPATTVDSLRHTGPLTRTVADAALSLNVMCGPDERDAASLPAVEVDYLTEMERGIENVRIAYSADLGYATVDTEVASECEQAAARLAEAGAHVEQVELDWQDPYECWQVFFYGGIGARLADDLETRGHLLDPGLLETVKAGLELSGVDYVRATLARNDFWQTVRTLFERYDLLVSPALALGAFPAGQNVPDSSGQNNRPLDWTPFTYPFNLTGQPAVTVPCGWTKENLPIGLQLVGRRFNDALVLRAARAWEQIQPWADRRPGLMKML